MWDWALGTMGGAAFVLLVEAYLLMKPPPPNRRPKPPWLLAFGLTLFVVAVILAAVAPANGIKVSL